LLQVAVAVEVVVELPAVVQLVEEVGKMAQV
jgi:hypothetical protein